jgi:YD repeat-containing protein
LDNNDDTYTPYPGVQATLIKASDSYTLQETSQNKYVFDLAGKLQTSMDPQGQSFLYTYDSSDRLEQVSAAMDSTRFLHFDYDSQGRLLEVKDQTSRGVSFTYDEITGELKTATDVLDNPWQYSYDSAHHLIEVKDPDNAVVLTNEYLTPNITAVDFTQHTISDYGTEGTTNNAVVEDNGNTIHLTGNTWKKIDLPYPVTDQTILEFDFKSTTQGDLHAIGFDSDDVPDLSQVVKLYGMENSGNLAYDNYSSMAPGVKHYVLRLNQMDYDLNTASLFFINKDMGTNPVSDSYFSNIKIYEETASGKIERQVDGYGKVIAKFDYAPEGVTTITDALENKSTHTYLPSGILLKKANALGNAESKSFDLNFRPRTITDPAGNTTQLSWSADGANLTGIIDAAEHQTSITTTT